MGAAVRAPLPLITAQENAGKINLPSQYISLQGADLACCFFTPSHVVIRHAVIVERRGKKTMKHNHRHNKWSQKFRGEGVEICWIPKCILREPADLLKPFLEDCLESWNWQIFPRQESFSCREDKWQKSGVECENEGQARATGVDEFLGPCPRSKQRGEQHFYDAKDFVLT